MTRQHLPTINLRRLTGIAAFVWVVLSRVLDAALVEEWE